MKSRIFGVLGSVFLLLAIWTYAQDVDLTMLPIGTENVGDSPSIGGLWVCNTAYDSGIGGAQGIGPWIDTSSNTFDFTGKLLVDGQVMWDHEFTVTVNGDTRVLSGNGLPDHDTGTYPIASNDDAYQIDRNPNSISAQQLNVELPANPVVAAEPSCLGMGAVGVMLTGVVFFNATDAEGRDAVAYETQDACQGHPEVTGEYHYHNLSTCVEEGDTGEGHSPLMGYVMDGFGIYGHHGENGEVITNEDLDECHGHTHMIEWDGAMVEMYHYHATYEFPYTVGCYRGEPVVTAGAMGGGQGQPQGGGQNQPPQGGGGQNPPQGGGNPPPTRQGGGNPPPPRNG